MTLFLYAQYCAVTMIFVLMIILITYAVKSAFNDNRMLEDALQSRRSFDSHVNSVPNMQSFHTYNQNSKTITTNTGYSFLSLVYHLGNQMTYLIFYFIIVLACLVVLLASEDKLYPNKKPKYPHVGFLIVSLFWPLFFIWVVYLLFKGRVAKR